MKPAFHILPENTGHEPMQLLVETGTHGISFSWYMNDCKEMKGLSVYNFPQPASPTDIAESINGILQSQAVFNEQYSSVTICFDVKESILVPAPYYKEATARDLLNLQFDTDESYVYRNERVDGLEIVHAYAVDKVIEKALTGKFPSASIFHSTTLELKRQGISGNQLYCIVNHNTLKVILYKDGMLQIAQQFSYSKHVDAAYHLLSCCERYGITTAEVTLLLSGFIDSNSMLYNELYKYFSHIVFEKPGDIMNIQERIRFYPPHFFSHLTVLATCAS